MINWWIRVLHVQDFIVKQVDAKLSKRGKAVPKSDVQASSCN